MRSQIRISYCCFTSSVDLPPTALAKLCQGSRCPCQTVFFGLEPMSQSSTPWESLMLSHTEYGRLQGLVGFSIFGSDSEHLISESGPLSYGTKGLEGFPIFGSNWMISPFIENPSFPHRIVLLYNHLPYSAFAPFFFPSCKEVLAYYSDAGSCSIQIFLVYHKPYLHPRWFSKISCSLYFYWPGGNPLLYFWFSGWSNHIFLISGFQRWTWNGWWVSNKEQNKLYVVWFFMKCISY